MRPVQLIGIEREGREAAVKDRKRLLVVTTLLVLLAGTTNAIADGNMEFGRLEPRWVTVQVVTTIPGDPEPRLSEPALAWYQADPGRQRRTVTVPG